MIFFKLKIRMWWNDFKRMSFGKSLKFFFFSFLAFLLVYGLYWGFFRLLSYLSTVALIGQLLIIKLLSIAFLWMFIMVIVSSLISGFSTIYFSPELSMWMYSPVSAAKIFFWKTCETSFYASWMILLAIAPFLAAYARVKGLGISFYFVLAGLTLPFLLIASCIGIIICTVLVSAFPHRRMRDGIIIIVVLIGSGIYIAFRFMQPEAIVRPDVFERVLQYVAVIQAPTAVYLPSWWITGAIQSFAAKDWEDCVLYSVILISTALFFLLCISILGKWVFYHGWAGAQEKGIKKKKDKNIAASILKGSFLECIAQKDIKIFFRDVNQWTQLLILSAIIIVYLFSIYKLPLDTWYLRTLISFINIGLIGFVLAAVSLRLVFPAISLEGSNYWLLCAAPISKSRIMWMKFLYSFPIILCIGLILVIISNGLLGSDRFVHMLSIGSIVLITFTLSGMGIGMGSLFPRFDIDNVARIESSFGGILYMIFSFFYIGFIMVVAAYPMRMYFVAKAWNKPTSYSTIAIGALGVMAIISVVLFVIIFRAGKKNLIKYEGI